jgi:hypothetical protein
VVESGALLKRCTPKGYPGFESLPHRCFSLGKLSNKRITSVPTGMAAFAFPTFFGTNASRFSCRSLITLLLFFYVVPTRLDDLFRQCGDGVLSCGTFQA